MVSSISFTAMGRARNRRPRPAEIRDVAMRVALQPMGVLLTIALRRAARLDPGAFDRLGQFREAVYIIAPTDAPVAFVLEPRGEAGRVLAVPRGDDRPCIARISGPMFKLLGLFDGSLDADSAFFRREIKVEGDTEAMLALHNALEAADINIADLAPAPNALRPPLRRLAAHVMPIGQRILARMNGQ